MSTNPGYAVSAYRKTSYNVSPIEAVILVYDEIISCLLRLDVAIIEKRFEDAFLQVQRAATMCRGLQVALDYSASEDVAKTLDSYYNKFIMSLHLSYGREDQRERYQKLTHGMLGLRNAWAENGNLPLRRPSFLPID